MVIWIADQFKQLITCAITIWPDRGSFVTERSWTILGLCVFLCHYQIKRGYCVMEVNGKHYLTIWMEHGTVHMIDQNKLPFSL
jgi:hypothetical protein